MPVVPPIFVRGDDLYVFGSLEAVDGGLEPMDVEPGWRAYDAEGRLLRVQVMLRGEVQRLPVRTDLPGAQVVLMPAEEEPAHADELKGVLADWLGVVEGTGTRPEASLPDQVERARKYTEATGAPVPRKLLAAALVAALALAAWAVWGLVR